MTTANYDRAVTYYDETRGYRPGVSEGYRDSLRRITGASSETRYLELAIGTGLIGLPFIAAGDDYAGVDISRGMMGEMAPKLPAESRPRLAVADVAYALPFANDSFDVLHAVRVFHLLGDWRRCISESKRVLRPGGQLIIVEMRLADAAAEPPPWQAVHDRWQAILRAHGIAEASMRHGNGLTEDMVVRHLQATGVEADVTDLLTYTELPVSCRTMVERRAARMFSNDWALPDETHQAATRALRRWLNEECEIADVMVERQMIFRAVVARF